MNLGFLYAGQGSQHPGMGADLYERFPTFRAVLDSAAARVDFDLKEVSFTDAKGVLNQTRYTQPCMVAFAAGMTALLDAVNEKSNITVVISDNLTTGMTGGQDSAGTGRLEQICAGPGVEPEHIRVVVPLPKNMEEIRRTIREEIEYKGVSVIIPRRECIQTAKRHNAKKQ